MALTVEGRDFRSRCEPLGCATRRSNLGVSTAATKKGAFGMTCDSGQARRLTARRSVRLERGTKFAHDSLVEERVSSEPVSEVGFSGLAIRHDSGRFMDDNRSGKGYFGLENGGISVFALGRFSCSLHPKT